MKKLFALLSVATVVSLASCGGESKEAASTDSLAVDSAVVVDTAVVADSAAADSTVKVDSAAAAPAAH